MLCGPFQKEPLETLLDAFPPSPTNTDARRSVVASPPPAARPREAVLNGGPVLFGIRVLVCLGPLLNCTRDSCCTMQGGSEHFWITKTVQIRCDIKRVRFLEVPAIRWTWPMYTFTACDVMCPEYPTVQVKSGKKQPVGSTFGHKVPISPIFILFFFVLHCAFSCLCGK